MAFIFNYLITDIIFASVVIFAALYFYYFFTYQHWKKRGIYFVEPTLVVGNLDNTIFQKESVVELFRRIYREAAGHKVAGIYIFHKPMLLARDLDVVRSVMAKDAHAFMNRSLLLPEKFDRLLARSLFGTKGKKWRHLRIKLTPTFTSGKMKMMLQLIEECSVQLLKYIDHEVSEGRSVAVKEVMSRYTMDAIASCAFGLNVNALDDPRCDFIKNMKNLFEPTGIQILLNWIVIFFPWTQHLISAKLLDTGCNDFVRKTFWDVVDYRKNKKIVRKDFVDLLVQLREEGEVRAEDAKDLEEIKQDSKYVSLEYSKSDDSNINIPELDDDDIVAQALIFMAAGYETSSSVLRSTLFELALDPAIQDRLRKEIEDVLEKNDHKVTYDAIAGMTYLDMVVSEAMRKYPPLYFVERECVSDCKLEGTNITVEKGTPIVIPIFSIHYDPDIYPDPEKFDPERFNAVNKHSRSSFAYLPFGEGPRKCIGMRFGLMQVKMGLVQVLKTFQVRPCKDTPEAPLQMKEYFDFLTPKKEIVLSFTKLK